jgi:hypothetical protein
VIVAAAESRDFAKLTTFPQRAHEEDPEIAPAGRFLSHLQANARADRQPNCLAHLAIIARRAGKQRTAGESDAGELAEAKQIERLQSLQKCEEDRIV